LEDRRLVREEGIQIGRDEGIQLGMDKGIQLGRDEGIQLGRDEGIQLGRDEGIQLGLDRGRREEALEIARQMREDGFAPEQIRKYTGLPLEDIREPDDES
jgi:predicted transposase YdaD